MKFISFFVLLFFIINNAHASELSNKADLVISEIQKTLITKVSLMKEDLKFVNLKSEEIENI